MDLCTRRTQEDAIVQRYVVNLASLQFPQQCLLLPPLVPWQQHAVTADVVQRQPLNLMEPLNEVVHLK